MERRAAIFKHRVQPVSQKLAHLYRTFIGEMRKIGKVFRPGRDLRPRIDDRVVLRCTKRADGIIHPLLHVDKTRFLQHRVSLAPRHEHVFIFGQGRVVKAVGMGDNHRLHTMRAQFGPEALKIPCKDSDILFGNSV